MTKKKSPIDTVETVTEAADDFTPIVEPEAEQAEAVEPEEQPTEQPAEPTEKRGRKKLSPDEKLRRKRERDRLRRAKLKGNPEKPKKAAEQESEKSIEDILNEHNETVKEEIDAPEVVEVSNRQKGKISGMILLTVIDAFLPLMFVKIAGMFSKKFKGIDAQKVKLTDEEKTDLSEIADEVAATIDANPVLLLSISLGGIYLSKIAGEMK